jgi:hypothetical protein
VKSILQLAHILVLTGIDKLVLREAQLRRLPRPSQRMHRNFMDFIYTSHPFSDADERFIYHESDFVSLEEHEGNWLDELMHRFVGHCRTGILRVRYSFFFFFFCKYTSATSLTEKRRPSSSHPTIKLRRQILTSTTTPQTA